MDIKLPRNWSDLTDAQLKYYFKLQSFGYTNERLLTNCFRRWAGIKTIKETGDSWHISMPIDGKIVNVKLEQYQVDYCVRNLSWLLDETPGEIICISKIGDSIAVNKELEGVSFESYLIAENYYQGYLATGSETYLQGLANQLYKGGNLKIEAWSALAIVSWWYSFKLHLTRRYHYLFQSIEGGDSDVVDHRSAVNAQIRALTKGDVTKDLQVKQLSSEIALTELNEMAKEAKELRKQMNK